MGSKDERIVQMTFDNQQFEKGVAQSRQTLKDLEKSLQLEEGAKGFAKISKAAENVDLSAIERGVEAIQDRFSLFGIMGMRVIDEIAGAAINFGKNLWNMTFGQIKSGGIRRAMNVENAHFMLQGLLKDEERVQKIMSWAMDSVDGTAYSYDAAAKAASQFAASNVTAEEDMRRALRGITGVAAMTNAEYEDISRIFTTVAGNGRLMGEQLLQFSGRGLNAAATIKDFFNGINDGTKHSSENVEAYVKNLTKGLQVSEEQVREFVSKGKINFDTFSAAMDEAFGEHAKKANETLTGVLSNVKAALAKIGADFVSPLVTQNGPLVEFFNALREAINKVRKELGPFTDTFVSTAKNVLKFGTNFLNFIHPEYVIQAMAHVLQVLKDILKPIGEAFREVFGEKSVYRMGVSVYRFKQLVESIKVSEKAVRIIHSVFGGFFAALSIGGQVFKALLQLVSPLVERIFGFGVSVADATGNLGDHIIALDKWLKETGFLNDAVEKIQNTVGRFVDFVKSIFQSKFVQGQIELFKKIIGGVVDFLKNKFGSFEKVKNQVVDFFGKVKTAISNFLSSDTVQTIKNVIRDLLDRAIGLKDVLVKIGSKVAEVFRTIFDRFTGGESIKTTAIDIITNAFHLFGEALEFVFNLVVNFSGTLGSILGGVGSAAGGILGSVIEGIRGLFTSFNEGKGFSLSDLFDVIVIAKIIKAIGNFGEAVKKFTDAIDAEKIKTIAYSIGILTLALVGIANIEEDRLSGAVTTITVLFGELVGAFKLMKGSADKIQSGSIVDKIKSIINVVKSKEGISGLLDAFRNHDDDFKPMVDLAKSILLVSGALVILSFIPTEKLKSSVSALTIIIGELVGAFALIARMDTTKAEKSAGMMVTFAVAIGILSAALGGLSKLDMDGIERGALGLAYIMLELALFMKSLSKSGGFQLKGGVSFVLLATSMIIFGKALKSISGLNYEQLVAGLIGLAGGLITMSAAISMISGIGSGSMKIMASATAIAIVSGSMVVLAEAANKIGSLDENGMKAALITLPLLLAAITTAFNAMPKDASFKSIGAGFIFLSTGMLVLASAINKIASAGEEGATIGMQSILAFLGMATLAFKLLENSGGFDVMGVAAAFNILAGSLLIIGLALKAVGSVNIDGLTTGLHSFILILGMFAVILAGMPDDKKIGKTALAIMGMSTALGLVSTALLVFSLAVRTLASGNMKNVAGSMAVLMLALGGMTIALSKLAKSGPKVLAAAGALTAISGTIVIIAGAISLLSALPVNALIASVGAIGIALASFTLVLYFLAPMADQIMKLGVAFASFGAGIAIGGLGIAAVTLAIAGLTAALAGVVLMGDKFIVGIVHIIKAVGEAVGELLGMILVGLAKGFADVIDYLAKHGEDIGTAIINLLKELTKIIVAAIPLVLIAVFGAVGESLKALIDSGMVKDIFNSVLLLVVQVLDLLIEYAPTIIEKVLQLVYVVVDKLGEHVGEILDHLLTFLENLLNGLAEQIVNHADPLVDAVKNIFRGIFYFIITLLQEVLRKIPGIGDEVADDLEGVKDKLREGMSPEAAAKFAKDYERYLTQELDKANRNIEALNNLPNLTNEQWAAAQARSFAMVGDDSMTAYIIAMDNALPHIKSKAEEILNSSSSIMDKQKQLYELFGGEIIDYYSRGVDGKAQAISEATDKMFLIQDLIAESHAKKGEDYAKLYGTSYGNGIDDLAPSMKAHLYDLFIHMDEATREQNIANWRAQGQNGLAAYFEALETNPVAFERAKTYFELLSLAGIDAISNTKDEAEQSALSVGLSAVEGFRETKGMVKDAVGEVVGSAKDTIDEYIPEFNLSGSAETASLTDGVVSGSDEYIGALKNLGEEGLENVGDLDGFFSTGESNINSATSGATSAGDNYIRVMKQIGNKGPLELVRQKNEYRNAGSGNIGEYSAGLGSSSALKDITNAIADGVSRALQKLIAYGRDFNSRGAGNISEYAKGMTSSQREAENAASSVAGSAERGLGSKNASFKAQGNSATKSFAGGLEAFGSVVRGSAAVIAQKGVEGSGSRKDQFTGKGRDAGQGFANGMEEKNSVVYNKAWSLAGRALAGLQERLRSNSPSKETMALGNYAGDGFAIGISQYGTTVKRISEDLAGEALDGLQNGMKEIARIADMDMDYAPTIRPVLDLNSITNGITAMNGMFDDSHAIAAQASFDMYQTYGKPDYITQFAKMAADNESRMSKIIDKQTDVLLDIRTRLAHQQIVLDSGELVGATINKIDEALGERMFRAERGNG